MLDTATVNVIKPARVALFIGQKLRYYEKGNPGRTRGCAFDTSQGQMDYVFGYILFTTTYKALGSLDPIYSRLVCRYGFGGKVS